MVDRPRPRGVGKLVLFTPTLSPSSSSSSPLQTQAGPEASLSFVRPQRDEAFSTLELSAPIERERVCHTDSLCLCLCYGEWK